MQKSSPFFANSLRKYSCFTSSANKLCSLLRNSPNAITLPNFCTLTQRARYHQRGNNEDDHMAWSSSPSQLRQSRKGPSNLDDPMFKCSLTIRLQENMNNNNTTSFSDTSALFLQLVETLKSELGATTTHLASSLGHDLIIAHNEQAHTSIEIIVSGADELFTDEQVTVNIKSQDLKTFTQIVNMCMNKLCGQDANKKQ